MLQKQHLLKLKSEKFLPKMPFASDRDLVGLNGNFISFVMFTLLFYSSPCFSTDKLFSKFSCLPCFT